MTTLGPGLPYIEGSLEATPEPPPAVRPMPSAEPPAGEERPLFRTHHVAHRNPGVAAPADDEGEGA